MVAGTFREFEDVAPVCFQFCHLLLRWCFFEARIELEKSILPKAKLFAPKLVLNYKISAHAHSHTGLCYQSPYHRDTNMLSQQALTKFERKRVFHRKSCYLSTSFDDHNVSDTSTHDFTFSSARAPGHTINVCTEILPIEQQQIATSRYTRFIGTLPLGKTLPHS